MNIRQQAGFTLIELAVVFVIIAALLSYTFMPLRSQMETAYIKEARAKLNEIEESLYGYAIANGRLPCPTEPGEGGIAQPATPASPAVAGADTCDVNIGFVPSNTLGIKGKVNCDGLLTDPWGRPYRYSVTNTDLSDNGDDFLEAGQLRSVANGGEGIANVTPDLRVCSDLDENCAALTLKPFIVADNVPAVIFSMGTRERGNTNREDENAGEGAAVNSTCGLPAYLMGGDEFYYSAQRRETAGSEFDDILIWISPNILYGKLLQAGQIP